MAANQTSFKKGQSGNPLGGKIKSPELRELEAMCKEHTKEALATILTIMANGENERNRLSAAQYVIDRGWGKPKQAMELSGNDGQNLSIEVTYVDAASRLDNNRA